MFTVECLPNGAPNPDVPRHEPSDSFEIHSAAKCHSPSESTVPGSGLFLLLRLPFVRSLGLLPLLSLLSVSSPGLFRP